MSTCFQTQDLWEHEQTVMGDASYLFRGAVTSIAERVYHWYQRLVVHYPPVRFTTPMGGIMQVETLSCGQVGWVSDAQGYRYAPQCPNLAKPWPSIPPTLIELAKDLALRAGYPDFTPDTCLLNRYAEGTSMGLHQDKNERDFSHPVVSFSFGVSAVFLWGGWERSGLVRKLAVHDGDCLVWGGVDRLRFHGIECIPPQQHALWKNQRLNLTFRVAQ